MTWLRHTDPPPPAVPHVCPYPVRPPADREGWEPDGEHGDLWMCDDCGAIWIVYVDNCFGVRLSDWHRVFWRDWWYRRKYLEKR